jgi:RHS repeat-associated protein
LSLLASPAGCSRICSRPNPIRAPRRSSSNALGIGYETTGSTNTYYRRDTGGGLQSERLPSGAVYYYVFDGLGSVRALTDSNGVAQNAYSYEPYGITGIIGSVYNPWQFASGYHDSTNWYKYGMRYYSARLGRWSQLDPQEQPTDPLQQDRFVYWGTIRSTSQIRAETASTRRSCQRLRSGPSTYPSSALIRRQEQRASRQRVVEHLVPRKHRAVPAAWTDGARKTAWFLTRP